MTMLHIVGLILAVLAGACFLLAAFGSQAVAGIGLVPLGLLFLVAFLACIHSHSHPHTT